MEFNIDALRKLRTEAGFTQENMADAMKMTQSSYNRLENGKTRLKLEKHIALLANAINKTTEEVFGQLIGCSVVNDSVQHKQNAGLADRDLVQQLFAEKDRLITLLQAENTRLLLEIERLKRSSPSRESFKRFIIFQKIKQSFTTTVVGLQRSTIGFRGR